MATCCALGRSRPLLVIVGLIAGVLAAVFLAVWLAMLVASLTVLAPAAAVSRRARAHWRRRAHTLAATLQVSREKLHAALEGVAPRTRCRVSAALVRVNPGAAGLVYRHFAALCAALLAALGVLSYVAIRALAAG